MSDPMPMQPIVVDPDGTFRFRENRLVRYLLDHGGLDLNALAVLGFPQADREQFAQLIGYSICGFHELSYVSDSTAHRASGAAKKVGATAGGCRDNGCPIHCGVEQEVQP